MDALHTQVQTAHTILQVGGGDFVMFVKGNQSGLLEQASQPAAFGFRISLGFRISGFQGCGLVPLRHPELSAALPRLSVGADFHFPTLSFTLCRNRVQRPMPIFSGS